MVNGERSDPRQYSKQEIKFDFSRSISFKDGSRTIMIL